MVSSKPRKFQKASKRTEPALSPNSIGLYTSAPQRAGTENRQKVTISVNGSLLSTVDEYTHQTGSNRSAVFEQALLMWCQWLQEQADITYYANLTDADRKANESWNQITTEAAK